MQCFAFRVQSYSYPVGQAFHKSSIVCTETEEKKRITERD